MFSDIVADLYLADLSLHWAHLSEGMFSDIAADLYLADLSLLWPLM